MSDRPDAARLRVAILISGRGSNMAALIEAASDPAYPATICLVISNVAGAGGLAIARAHNIPALCIDHLAFRRDRAAHERAIDDALVAHRIQAVCLAGYMRLLTPCLVSRWAGRMLNIHPSLLPEFPGLDTHARALAAGAARHGCTVHLVTDGMDEGKVLAQAGLDVAPDETEASLAARVLALEHTLYPACLAAFAKSRGPAGGAQAGG